VLLSRPREADDAPMRYPPTGTRELWLNHRDNDWSTNGHVYRFPPVVRQHVRMVVVKHPNKTVVIEADGPFGRRFNFRLPMPTCDGRGLHVVITWENQVINFYLNGQLAESFTLP
jgi:hypothetical protein